MTKAVKAEVNRRRLALSLQLDLQSFLIPLQYSDIVAMFPSANQKKHRAPGVFRLPGPRYPDSDEDDRRRSLERRYREHYHAVSILKNPPRRRRSVSPETRPDRKTKRPEPTGKKPRKKTKTDTAEPTEQTPQSSAPKKLTRRLSIKAATEQFKRRRVYLFTEGQFTGDIWVRAISSSPHFSKKWAKVDVDVD